MPSAVGATQCEQAAIRAYLLGVDDECAAHWEAAHRAALASGDCAEAARYAFWLGLNLMLRGQVAPANGWFTRAESLIATTECPASGYLLITRCLTALEGGDAQRAYVSATDAGAVADRFADRDLRAFAALAQGQALIAMGRPNLGVARLDDVMVSVCADECGPVTTGIVYCAVILECMGLFDLPRAREWTDALSRWCEQRPGMVPFRGQCMIHRSQLQQAEGDWPAAMLSARDACRRLDDPPHPALGLACYQLGELDRLLGDFDQAERDYRRAARNGYDPVPGIALLRLARGNRTDAVAMIGRALQEGGGQSPRPEVMSASVEIFCAVGDFIAARAEADMLSTVAAATASPVLQAMAAVAAGSVSLAEGDAGHALVELRSAARTWQALHMPYDAARARLTLGSACAVLGDRTSAEMEFEGAREVFAALGAVRDVAQANSLLTGLSGTEGSRPTTAPCTLTGREREVLVALAAGLSNREIAAALVVSPHTVARHVEHIYAKLGVTNRTSATAYAYEHHLV